MNKQRLKIDTKAEYEEYVSKANSMTEAMHVWAASAPLSPERAKLWDQYLTFRNEFEVFQAKLEARAFH